MADEPIQSQTQTAPEAPKTGGGETTDKISLSRADYDALKSKADSAESASTKAKDLETLWSHTQNLLRQDVDDQAKETAVRTVLARAGYKGEEIDEYVAQVLGSEEQAPSRQPRQTTRQPAPDPQDNPQIRALADEVNRQRSAGLQRNLQESVREVLDGDTEVTKFLSRLKDLNGDEGVKAARSALDQEIRRQTMDQLRVRRDTTGRFEEGWIAEEAAKAAPAIVQKYRSVIGDLNKLGKTPETVSGEDMFLKSKPVELPDPRKTDPREQQGALTNWIRDQLARTTADAIKNSEGSSRA